MARWATLCEIAGVSFTGCRVEIVDSEELLDSYAGSVDWGNDHTVHAQAFNAGAKGKFVILRFISVEIEDHLEDVIDAIETAQAANTTFVVEVSDGIYIVNANCIKDLTQKWLTHGKHSEGWYETVTMRFLIKTPVS